VPTKTTKKQPPAPAPQPAGEGTAPGKGKGAVGPVKTTGTRGNSILYSTPSDAQREEYRKREAHAAPPKPDPGKAPVDRIAEGLKKLAVPLAKLVPDPENARLHPERNMEAIKLSLGLYGQVKPLVVRKQSNVVVAGNGTLEAAKQLGWTKLACVFVDMTRAEAAGYGLADNRTAELAKWDIETVARLQKLIEEQGGSMVGWSDDECMVLRAADWTPPEESDEEFSHGSAGERLSITLFPEQRDVFDRAVQAFHDREFARFGGEEGGVELEMTEAECLVRLCLYYLGEDEQNGEGADAVE
jgi:hypothetical protein